MYIKEIYLKSLALIYICQSHLCDNFIGNENGNKYPKLHNMLDKGEAVQITLEI